MQYKKPEYCAMIEDYINSYRNRQGSAPSVRQIAAGVGLAVGTVSKYLSYMRENGVLDYDGHRSVTTRKTRGLMNMLYVPLLGAVSCGVPKFAEENIRVVGSVPYNKSLLPENFVFDSGMDDNCAIYQLEPLAILSDLKDRLVIDWGRGTINWCQNGTTAKEILEIRPAQSEIRFKSYEDVILSFDTLHTIVYNQSAYKEWYDKLSAVAGVYLITDKRTGKHYVGSASGEQGGIWGRWSEYARTKHGGNKRLIELINADPEYCHNFQYSILEVFPIKKDRQEVLECERLPCQRSHHPGRA